MTRPHDIGGLEGFGPVNPDESAMPFDADWEARVFALGAALSRQGIYSIDEFRDAVERMPPQRYLECSYYERYLVAICRLLVEKGLVERSTLDGLGIDA